MTTFFEPLQLGDITLSNRIIMAPMTRGRANDAGVQPAFAATSGSADAIVYGKQFLANPDLPERFRRNAVLNAPDFSTFYTSGSQGYTDYQSLSLQ